LASRKYELFEPLHQLWKGYVEELFGSSNPLAFTQKLLKADFHGALITGKIRSQQDIDIDNEAENNQTIMVLPARA
jgi:hypothetical protein